ncbi:hypothetical protein NLU13_4708 [Sarocladium strictum]|uniref:Histone-lysine N-methyltransferase, H3 lysine-79 specific n=1 Tax=Sarocladium strictum TaxID=5046 RepID=A0AA39GL35_SARSR|nr:hypothetical protein NLU13_4708 [Sarocladium strictum]
MPLLGRSNKFKSAAPKIRVEKVAAPSKPPPNAPKSFTSASARANLTRSPALKPSPNRSKNSSPLLSSSDERRPDRKRKAGTASSSRRSPASDRVEFDKDSDGEDDGWMSLETRKRQRRAVSDSSSIDSKRKLKNPKSFDKTQKPLKLIHAEEIASLATGCVAVMGAKEDEVALELQYPSLQPRERYQLVWGKEKIDAVDACIRVVRHVAETFLSEEEAEPFTNQTSGIIRRLEKASNRNIQDLSGFKSALSEYNQAMARMIRDGTIAKNLDQRHELPRSLVEFILDQIYDRCVAPDVHLLSKYKNGTDNVYGELLHPFVSRILVEQLKMKSDQVFVDLGSGVGNVVLQAALEIGCESWGCEMMKNACDMARLQEREFRARTTLWGVQAGRVHLEEGDFTTNAPILEVLKRADVVLVNNKAFTSTLNDRLVSMFLDLKIGCKVVSLKSFVSVNSDADNSYNSNDVGSSILTSEEYSYPEGFVSWTNAGGPYYIATRKAASN